jgi:hypothetical protein
MRGRQGESKKEIMTEIINIQSVVLVLEQMLEGQEALNLQGTMGKWMAS